MSFIRAQRIVRDDSGRIVSGSATIRDSIYVKTGTKQHCKQVLRERLGKVIWFSADKKSGIFLSPLRGLIEYNSKEDVFKDVEKDDPRLENQDALFPPTEVHTVFGDFDLITRFMNEIGIFNVLKIAIPDVKKRIRAISHILHSILKDGSKISCNNFLEKSAASYILDDIPLQSLRSDTCYFKFMGNDNMRMSFFKTFIAYMRKTNKNFGKCCYVDSTPLPNDMTDNPFNALCSHGVGQAAIQVRLALVLDQESGLPVWYEIIPGNVLDINTLHTIAEDLKHNLDVDIDSMVLDAGYVSKDLIVANHIGTSKTFIGRMPNKKGYPFKDLYKTVKPLLSRGKYTFIRDRHVYFGYKRKVTVFGQEVWTYVYLDKNNALQRSRDWIVENLDEYAKMKDYEKDWLDVKYGFFVLISNIDGTPESILDEYFGRSYIETVIKTDKEYLGLLPLSKWTMDTVRGKILHDIISLIIYMKFRKQITESGDSISNVIGKMQSLMCFKIGSEGSEILIETPNKQVKQYYKLFGYDILSHIKIEDLRNRILGN